MGVFAYSAKDGAGKRVNGMVRAGDKGGAVANLRNKGFSDIKVKDAGAKKLSVKMPSKDLAAMTRQLSTMISAGLTIVDALETLYEQASDRKIKLMLDAIIEKVRAGSELSTALADHPRTFDKIYLNMIRASEASGQLDTILGRLADYMEASEELKREIKGAMTYPVISLCLILSISGCLILFVLPQFKKMFNDMGMKELPFFTAMVMGISDFARGNFIPIIIGAGVGFYSFKKAIATNKGQKVWHRVILKAPVFGLLIQKVCVARFCRTLGTLLEAGVTIVNALEIAGATSGNRIIEDAARKAKEQVSQGKALSEPLSECTVFPVLVLRMIAVGEKTGQLEQLLKRISEFFEAEVHVMVKSLSSLLEPMMIVVLGGIVGSMVLAIFQPIFQMQSKLAGGGGK